MEDYGFKPRDLLHAATMLAFGPGDILTGDADFDEIYWIKRVKL
jgi:predicted nucleic acid-binding protein